MIRSKAINVITAVFLCLSVCTCAWIVYAANHSESVNVTEYQKKLFSGEVAVIDIQVDEEDWRNLLDHASNKEYISGVLVINGESFGPVGIRAKGNSSLSQVVSSDSDRYSLQFKMNEYVKGQTYYGLDSFCINNMLGDATYMKDYISYDIMRFIGVETPLTAYADVTVNGESYGFCLLLERYDKAFLDRVYNTSAGQLYNVKIQMGQRDNFMQGNAEQANNARNLENTDAVNGNANAAQRDNRSMGGFGGSNGGSLVYTDDELSSYSSIFDNAVSSKVTDDDKQRVVTAIQHLNEGTDLEQYFDVDEILRYFAAHTVVVNLDSYISNMQQNYYIYERDGKITILPWDYGLSFGGFQSGSASDVVNFPIDTPVSGVSMEDRPLLNQLLEVEEYKERYHEYLRQIVEGYFNSGLFESVVTALDGKINEYVKNDTSAFYTYEQYEASLPVFIELGLLRAESIARQLDGTIPSTTSGQQADSASLIDASHINLSTLGTMGGGAGNGGFGGQRPDMQQGVPGGGQGERMQGGMDMAVMQSAMEILGSAEDGVLSEEQMGQLKELGLSETDITQLQQMFQNGFQQNGDRREPNHFSQDGIPQGADDFVPQGDGMQAPPGGQSVTNEGTVPGADDPMQWMFYGILFFTLFGGILFIALHKRRRMMVS